MITPRDHLDHSAGHSPCSKQHPDIDVTFITCQHDVPDVWLELITECLPYMHLTDPLVIQLVAPSDLYVNELLAELKSHEIDPREFLDFMITYRGRVFGRWRPQVTRLDELPTGCNWRFRQSPEGMEDLVQRMISEGVLQIPQGVNIAIPSNLETMSNLAVPHLLRDSHRRWLSQHFARDRECFTVPTAS